MFKFSRLLSSTVWILLAPAACAGAGGATEPGSEDGPAPLARLPFQSDYFLVLAEGSVESVGGLTFILDTGSNHHIIDREVARRAGVSSGPFRRRRAAARTVEIARASGVTLALGDIELPDQDVSVADLRDQWPILGRPMHGILGASLFELYTVEIDYYRRQIAFYDPEGYRYQGKGREVPLEMSNRLPFLTLELKNGERDPLSARLLLDTGSTELATLSGPESVRLFDPDAPRFYTDTGAGFGGTYKIRAFHTRIDALRIGPIEVKRPYPGGREQRAQSGLLGVVGGGLLHHFTAVIDYRRSRLLLEPNQNFGQPFQFDKSGLFLIGDEKNLGRIKILSLSPGSPAAQADLRVNDRLIEVDGRPVEELTLDGLRIMLRRPALFRLLVERDGKRLEVEMETQPLF